MIDKKLILLRGGGDLATGIAHRLFRMGFSVVIVEIEKPLVIRRTVAFAEALYQGEMAVEGVIAKKAPTLEAARRTIKEGKIPVIVDPLATSVKELKPFAVIDAILAKRNLGTNLSMAPVVIGVGPGFSAPTEVHAVIETQRGHDLGKVLLEGTAKANTGIPGDISGYTWQRVIRAEAEGVFEAKVKIGTSLEVGEVIGYIGEYEVKAPIKGILRGLIKEGLFLEKGLKIGDIDPRNKYEYCFTISEKARAIGGGVAEAIFMLGKKVSGGI